MDGASDPEFPIYGRTTAGFLGRNPQGSGGILLGRGWLVSPVRADLHRGGRARRVALAHELSERRGPLSVSHRSQRLRGPPALSRICEFDERHAGPAPLV